MAPETMIRALDDLLTAYPKEMQIDKKTGVLWARFLGTISDADFQEAVDHWIRTERHAPTIADMVQATDTLNSGGDEALWQRAIALVRGGSYRSPGFTCPPRMLAGVKAAGGWQVIGQTADADLHYRKREFMDALRGIIAPRTDYADGVSLLKTPGDDSIVRLPPGAVFAHGNDLPKRDPVDRDGLGKLGDAWRVTKAKEGGR